LKFQKFVSIKVNSDPKSQRKILTQKSRPSKFQTKILKPVLYTKNLCSTRKTNYGSCFIYKRDDIAAMIYGGGFVREGGVGTKMHDPFSEMQDQWTNLLDEANINGERLFVTQPTQQSTQPFASMPMRRQQVLA
jgi:hypothetical protein